MGRHAQPIQLHIINGNPNRLTKDEIERRQNSEIRFGNQDFKMSPLVRKNLHARRKWKEIIELYVMYGVDFVSTSDATILERYCLTYAEYVTLQEVREEVINKGWDKVKTYHAIEELGLENNINKKIDLLTKLEDRLILNPLSKIKTVPVKQSDKQADPNAAMFGD